MNHCFFAITTVRWLSL